MLIRRLVTDRGRNQIQPGDSLPKPHFPDRNLTRLTYARFLLSARLTGAMGVRGTAHPFPSYLGIEPKTSRPWTRRANHCATGHPKLRSFNLHDIILDQSLYKLINKINSISSCSLKLLHNQVGHASTEYHNYHTSIISLPELKESKIKHVLIMPYPTLRKHTHRHTHTKQVALKSTKLAHTKNNLCLP